MMERNELMKEIDNLMVMHLTAYEQGRIADFILADRKRIVEPLRYVKECTLYNFGRSGWIHHDNLLTKAIDNALKLAGLEK